MQNKTEYKATIKAAIQQLSQALEYARLKAPASAAECALTATVLLNRAAANMHDRPPSTDEIESDMERARR